MFFGEICEVFKITHFEKHLRTTVSVFRTLIELYSEIVRDHSFSTYAKFYEKPAFLTPYTSAIRDTYSKVENS